MMEQTDIKISPEFKAQTTKAIFAIALFVVTYLVMLTAAVGLTVLCLRFALLLIAFGGVHFLIIVLGLGLSFVALVVLYFLIKFIFSSRKVDRSHLIEIKEKDEPTLFRLIADIAQKVGTDMPKRVYLSHDVNASVFYDSNFWSMFFPIRKNLQIGMGLVNAVTHAELAAIISHEFGHFSQKSMKVGSYVYNVNQIIYNMLFNNDTYMSIINSWSRVSGLFAMFGVVAIRFAQGIQWVLRQMYGVVNKSYMGLSREMEFHADEIAASVTGYEPLKYSLLRLPLANHAMELVFQFYDKKLADNLKPANLFRDHFFALTFLARHNGIGFAHNLPSIEENQFSRFNKSKLVIQDQWASHPDLSDRIRMMEKTGFKSDRENHDSAKSLFEDVEATERRVTEHMLKNIAFKENPEAMPHDDFCQEFVTDFEENSFPKIYNSYYDSKNPLLFEIPPAGGGDSGLKLEELFSDEMVETVYESVALKNDIDILNDLASKKLDIRTFDYDGVKYKRKEARQILPGAEEALRVLNDKIAENDKRIYGYFRSKEPDSPDGSTLERLYREMFEYDKGFEAKYDLFVRMNEELAFVGEETPVDQIKAKFIALESLESKIKKEIVALMAHPEIEREISREAKENLDLYVSKRWEYFGHQSYFDSNLEMLYAALQNYAFLLSKGYFIVKRKLLKYQAELV